MSLRFIAVLLVCQLIGEIIVVGLRLPLPGPVLGMAVLFAGLLIRGRVSAGLRRTADGLLSHLSLLFVPAGVGVMLHVSLLADEWKALSIALILSAVMTVIVTGLAMSRLLRRHRSLDDAS